MRSAALLALAATLVSQVRAEDAVVFARHDYCQLDGAVPAAGGPERQSFLETASRDLKSGRPLDRTIPLVNPPSWGRTVRADSGGALEIAQAYPHGFRFNLTLSQLVPGHSYVLCINGRPQHPGNELLPQPVPRNPAEKYEDFYDATTDGSGRYRGRFALFLRRGAYNVHFYVKDPADHKIILYGVEYFDFAAD